MEPGRLHGKQFLVVETTFSLALRTAAFLTVKTLLSLHNSHEKPMDPAVEPQEDNEADSPLLQFVGPAGCCPLPVRQRGGLR